jgi:hypothetical protein
MSNWSPSPEAAAERLFGLAQDAAQLDDQSSGARLCLAWGYWRIKGNHEMAEAQIEEAIALNPNDLDNDLRGESRRWYLVLEPGDPSSPQPA